MTRSHDLNMSFYPRRHEGKICHKFYLPHDHSRRLELTVQGFNHFIFLPNKEKKMRIFNLKRDNSTVKVFIME